MEAIIPILTKSGKYEKAIKHLETALRLNPGNSETLEAIISILIESGKNAEAIEYLETALRFKPGNSEILEAIIPILIELGKYEEAIGYSVRLQDSAGIGSKYIASIASKLLDQGDWDGAETALSFLKDQESQKVLVKYLHTIPFLPSTLVPIDYKKDYKRFLPGCMYIFLGFFLLVAVVGGLGQGDMSAFVMIAMLAVIFFAVFKWSKRRKRIANERVIHINSSTSELDRIPTSKLKLIAHIAIRYEQGELTTPEQIAIREKEQRRNR